MTALFRRSILHSFLVGTVCTLAVRDITPLALAQHPAAHAAGVAVHASPPSIPHISVSPPGMMRPPIARPVTPRILGGSSGGASGLKSFPLPRPPIHRPPVLILLYPFPAFPAVPSWGWNSCWSTACDYFWPWAFTSNNFSSPGPITYVPLLSQVPVYVYGEAREDLPQLILKDGTIVNVTDYWLVDDQLHFKMIEDDSAKPAEHVIPFDALDLQTTVDTNTRRGFRFVLRNEPFEQYVRDHPQR